MALAYDDLATTTIDNWAQRSLEDNIFRGLVLLYQLKRKGSLSTRGGEHIWIPLQYGLNSTVGAYSGWDPLDITPQDNQTKAQYNWKQYSVSVAINGRELAMNSGPQQVIDLVEARTNEAESSAKEEFETDLFGSGTDSTDTFSGLKTIVSATATTGGIAVADASWWESHVQSYSNTDTNLTVARLNNAYNTVTRGKMDMKPDFEVTTQALYEAYEALLQPNQRYVDVDAANAGFDNILHKGNPVFWSLFCDAKYWYFLNSKCLKFVMMEGRWLADQGWVRVPDKDGKFKQILSMAELTTNNRRHLGVVTRFVASGGAS